MKKIKRLNEFLEKEGVLKEFYDNLRFHEEWKDTEPDRLIVDYFSFEWGTSKQGCDFWKAINAKYHEFLKEKPKRWKPEEGQSYWFVNTGEENGVYNMTWGHFRIVDKYKYKCGNVFQTEELAKEAFKRVKKCLKKYQKELIK